VATLCAATPQAWAGGAADQAAGVAMFQEAKKLASAGDFLRACPKFVEAQRLFPTTGTLLNLGNCYQQTGKLASAWGAFKQAEIAARNGGDADRQEEAAKRARALEDSLSKLTISAAGAAGTTLEVRRDGGIVGEGQLGTAVPVDAGEHVIEVTAPGRKKWTAKVQVEAGGVNVAVNIPDLPPETKPEVSTAEGGAWGPQRIAGVAIGGAGLVGLVVGAVFGAQAISKNSASKAACSPTDASFCNDMGVTLRQDAKAAGTVSTVGLAVGGVLVAGGVVLVLTAPVAKAKETARVAWVALVPRAPGGDVGMSLQGSW
jgi:hypothetical protein